MAAVSSNIMKILHSFVDIDLIVSGNIHFFTRSHLGDGRISSLRRYTKNQMKIHDFHLFKSTKMKHYEDKSKYGKYCFGEICWCCKFCLRRGWQRSKSNHFLRS